MIRVRFAPSPTGPLHIGAARTSLFNWLFARHYQASFILRIEDTDVTRSSEEMTKGILDGLKWLGLDWDEGPIFQSKRLEIYRQKAEELVQNGHAYYCYCLPEEIQKRKGDALSEGLKYWEYDRLCQRLSKEEKERFENEGRPKAIRFLVPEGEIKYRDLIHGSISVDSKNIEDFVLLRRDRLPTYHLSVVVDDLEGRITHVIRGDDHISNTPKQILLYKAFGFEPPEFAHLALIIGPDKKKLSKRHGVTSVLQFKEDGYFPLAMVNFLAQMSWSPGEEERIYSIEEMIKGFSLDKLSKGSPIFDLTKLEWLNGQLISQMSSGELVSYVKEEFERENLWQDDLENERKEWFLKLLDLLKERSRTIKDFPLRARPYLYDDISYDPEGVEKYLKDEKLEELLPKLESDFEEMEDFSAPHIEEVLRKRAEREGVKAALFIHAVRMLVVGEPVSPGIFNVLELVGKEKTLERINKFKTIG
ncbi:MAG: glutamate--tRNA ligase [Candidatus Aminicenantes bacterium]|nr:MAG: glutamate--tRNA ligase [Candidatus Aminicenantes bacterium]